MRKLTKNPKDLEVIKELEKMAMEEKWVYAYDHEIVRKKTENSIRSESYQKGIEQGIEQGSKQEKIAIAESMLKENLPIEIIIKCTGLNEKEIKILEK